MSRKKDLKIKRFIYASSSSVYGGNKKLPFSIRQRVDIPISLYAASKKSGELLAECYSKLFKIQCIGLRFFTVYGPWGRPDMATFIFTKKIIEKKQIDIFNFGKTFYQLNSMISKALDRIALRLNISIKSKDQNYNVNYNCGSSANKTKFVGDMIIRTWIQAQKLAKANGDIFVAILQPVTV